VRKDSAKNSLFSLLSLLFPVVLGLVFIPHFIRDFGKERFSFLSLVWALFGYFSFLDLGIGRTLTKIIAFEKSKTEAAPSFSFIASAQYIIFFVSFLFSVLVFLAAPAIVYKFLQISGEHHTEFINSIHIVAFGIPFVTLTSLNRSILEGFNDFASANILQILAGVFLFVMPAIAWKIDPSMSSVCEAIVFSRLIVYSVSHYFYKKKLPQLNWSPSATFGHFKMLMSHGVWITMSNILSPIMSSFDKILLGNITVLSNVAFYTTPMEMASRLWAIPSAVTRIFFPQFAATEEDEHIQQQFRHAGQIMGLFILPVCLVAFVFARELISVWIGPEFSEESYRLAQWMLIGILFNAFNWIPFGWLQATKHVHWTVYTVIIEAPLFLGAFYFFTERFGLVGAAAVWAGRLIFDYFLTYVVCSFFRPALIKEFKYSFLYLATGTVTTITMAMIPDLKLKILASFLCLSGFVFINRKLIKEMLVR
jgi:O-antigen/teichoic acid export membrane protein